MTEPEPVIAVIDASLAEPADDPTALLDVNVLPTGFTAEHIDRISLPTYGSDHRESSKRGKQVEILDALQELADTGLKLDSVFEPTKRAAAAANLLRTFEAQGLVQGIQTMPQAAIAERKKQIVEQQEQETRDTQAAFSRWSAIVGRLLHEQRAVEMTLRTHGATRPEDHLAAMRDLLEGDRADAYFKNETLEQLVDRYARTADDSNRAFVHAVEAGRRPERSHHTDAAAAVKLARLIRQRQAARLSPELRQAFTHFVTFAHGSLRGSKLELLRDRRVK